MTIYKVIAGSHSYGTSTPTSDMDTRGVFVPSKEYLIGLLSVEQKISTETDDVLYALQKYMRLALDANPNIIEMLFVDKKHILIMDEYGKQLRDNRDIFLSKKVYHTFSGYAYSQLRRIRGHYSWINNPVEKPDPLNYQARFDKLTGSYRFSDLNHARAYEDAKKKYDDYRSWVENRNPDRQGLEFKYGYDTKHAMHLVRLFDMGIEILKTNTLTVLRPNADELLEIRNGKYTYDELLDVVERKEKELVDAYANTTLPHSSNFNAAHKLCISIINEYNWK